jgi:hypothetical protein
MAGSAVNSSFVMVWAWLTRDPCRRSVASRKPQGRYAHEEQISCIAPQVFEALRCRRCHCRDRCCTSRGPQQDEQGRLGLPEPSERGRALRPVPVFSASAQLRDRAGKHQPKRLVQMVPRPERHQRADGLLARPPRSLGRSVGARLAVVSRAIKLRRHAVLPSSPACSASRTFAIIAAGLRLSATHRYRTLSLFWCALSFRKSDIHFFGSCFSIAASRGDQTFKRCP